MKCALITLMLVLIAAVCAAEDETVGKPVAVNPANEQVVGFEAALAGRMLLDEDRKRMAELPLQDLVEVVKGRYTHLKDDGVMGTWGLDAVDTRMDAKDKPYKLLLADGVYQTERIIFPDLSTGVTMMKLSDTPYGDDGDELFYFGKACFNADGSLMTWMRSRKAGLWGPGAVTGDETHGVLVTECDGTRPRVVFPGVSRLRIPVCHPLNPDMAYSCAGNDLVELNLREGETPRVIKKGLGCWWLKLSPDGKYACSKGYSRRELWVVELETGKKWGIPLDGAIHDSYRFVPGDTDWIMFWYEKTYRKEGIVLANFKTGKVIKNDIKFDWNHGDVGRFIGVHVSPYITEWDGRTKQWKPMQSLKQFGEKYVDSGPNYANPVHAGGYLQHWPDDQRWAYPSRYTARPWLSEIQCIFAKPFEKGYGRANWFRVCLTNHCKNTDRKGNKTIMLSRPNISFDGTKMLFNSNVFAKSEVYMAVLRKPQPPTGVKGVWKGPAVELTWKPPTYHQEIKGYDVYRSTESGRGFLLISDEPVRGTTFVDRGANGRRWTFYAVRSVEHSKLESGPSKEAMVNPAVNMPVPAPMLRIFAEAEDAIPADLKAPAPDAMWVNIDGTASNLYYIWQRLADKPGEVTLEMNMPLVAADYTVFARVKGKEGAEFTIAGRKVLAPAGDAWRWVKSQDKVTLKAGTQKITIASSKHGSCLDCFYLSTDDAFRPGGRIVATKPKAPKLTGEVREGYPQVTWECEKDRRFHHFNLYASTEPNFTPGRKTLVASPDGNRHLDWRAPAGKHFYRITQVTLDGLESSHSNEVSAERPPR